MCIMNIICVWQAHAEKKSKLANPNFYVSKTRYGKASEQSYTANLLYITILIKLLKFFSRLSVRNLPTQVCEQRLKEIFSSVTDSGKITQV